jgi:MFS family permease
MYTLPQSIVFMLAGRLSDIFGRRWFFIVGSTFGLLGSIVCATANSMPQLIAGETLIGIKSGFQNSFFWVVSEIVPMKRRFIANAGLFAVTIPTVKLKLHSPCKITLVWLLIWNIECPRYKNCIPLPDADESKVAGFILLPNWGQRLFRTLLVFFLPSSNI